MKTYFPKQYKPNSTLIGVAELARKDLLIEIELIAKIK
jgi:enamine deaminase RidA (YjgF/YER057c/UK114 family)